jgi:hypothetical protein
MAAINRYAGAGVCIVLLGGLAAGCSTHANREIPVPEIIPAQVCGGDADSDGDGVINCNDRCPNTLRGERVDADGCPLPIIEAKPFRG